MQVFHPPFASLARLRNGVLLGAALLMTPAFAAPPAGAKDADRPAATAKAKAKKHVTPAKKQATPAKAGTQGSKAAKASGSKSARSAKKPSGKKEAQARGPGPLADFGQAAAPADVVHVANWVSYSRNARKKAFVVIDKKQAQLYVFDPNGKLRSRTPVLLGRAVGDHIAPGVGTKPLSQIAEADKTTPAGRFLAQPGRNNHGEDIIWIDYNSAVSMHRLRKVGKEQRAERMATEDIADNRISNGCVNVPHKFYNAVLKPTVARYGAFVYVLPETKTVQQQFGSFDVPRDKRPA